ncbi:MAG: response regulator [Methanosarcinaceae archaeon]|nr:response regulator [Methanosarcinaceae archaeon]MDD4496561.1 response regulator [Methanosarcinaceae archaeon]
MPEILLVEDDLLNLELGLDLLRSYGYNPRKAVEGPDVFEILNKVKIDLILLDVELPKMSGLEVLKKIKTNPDTKNIRVVAFTGHSDPHHKQKFLEAGFYDVISKPINFKNFRFQIEKFLKE